MTRLNYPGTALRAMLGTMLAVAGLLTLLCAPAKAATHEGRFCWGKTLATSGPESVCYEFASGGAAKWASGIYASGDHSICIRRLGQPVGQRKCSEGPGSGVYMALTPNEYLTVPVIEINSKSATKVYGALYWQDPPPPTPPVPTWHGENLAAELTDEVTVSSWGQSRLDVFARGANNNLYHRWWDLNGWSAWENMGGNLASGPDAVSWGANRIDVVALMADETVGHWSWNSAKWAFDSLGGKGNINARPSISSRGSNSLDVFGRGTGGHLFQKTWTGSEWIGWSDLGGSLVSGPDSVSWSGERIDVVARVSGDSVGHWYGINGVWAYDDLGGITYSRPGVTSWGPNRLDVFLRGAENGLFHKYWSASAWSGWENMGGKLASGPDAVSWGTNRIDVVARHEDDTLDHWWWGL